MICCANLWAMAAAGRETAEDETEERTCPRCGSCLYEEDGKLKCSFGLCGYEVESPAESAGESARIPFHGNSLESRQGLVIFSQIHQRLYRKLPSRNFFQNDDIEQTGGIRVGGAIKYRE